MSTPLRVIFMGTPDFSVPCLQALHDHPEVANIVAVYTQPDRPAGRGQKITKPPVKILAEKLNLPVLQPEKINTPEQMRKLSSFLADVYVVVAYAKLLKPGTLNLPRIFCVNVHASLLPKFRGAAPIQYAIWKGENESGVTTMKMAAELDSGPMLLTKKIKIDDQMTGKELHDQLSILGSEVLIDTLKQLQSGDFKEIPQNHTEATFSPSLKKEQGTIYWNENSVEILNRIRAFFPWPGTFSHSSKGIIKILKAGPVKNNPGFSSSAKNADHYIFGNHLYVKCSDAWIEILELQPEGKQKISANDFINGIKNSPEFKFNGL